MKIGLLDCELIECPQLKTINVELMKVGAYYESYGHEVHTVTPLDNVFSYDKIVMGSNRVGVFTKIKKFQEHPNKDFVGTAYTNWNYIPTGIKELDYAQPNIKYYKELFNYLRAQGEDDVVEAIGKKKWIRLYPDEKHIELNSILTGERYNIVDTYFFDKPDWEETLLNLSIYNRYYSFVYPLIIRNSEDFDNFLKVLSYGFKGLKGVILISDGVEFEEFCKENKDKLNEYSTSITYEIGYDPANIYGEKFYLKELTNVFKKIQILNNYGIKTGEACRIDYSDFVFTSSIFVSLKEFFATAKNNYKTFNQLYTIKNRRNVLMLQRYRHFLNNNQQFYSLFNKCFKKKEGN